MGAAEVTQFLSALVVDHNVAVSTQNQAASALLFLYRDVLEQDLLPWALACKYPNAGRESAWQWIFPAIRISVDRTTGQRRRHSPSARPSTPSPLVRDSPARGPPGHCVPSRSFRRPCPRPPRQWHDHLGEPTLADVIGDRLLYNAHRLVLKRVVTEKGGQARQLTGRPASLRSDHDPRLARSRWTDLGVQLRRNTQIYTHVLNRGPDDGSLMRFARIQTIRRDTQTEPIVYPRPSVFFIPDPRSAASLSGASRKYASHLASPGRPHQPTALRCAAARATLFHRHVVRRTAAYSSDGGLSERTMLSCSLVSPVGA